MTFFILSLYAALFVCYAGVIIFFLYTLYAFVKGAPFVPTAKKNVKKMLALADLRQTDVLMDLGSGDGRILFAAAPNVRQCIGIEINPLLYWWSRIRTRVKRLNNVQIIRKNLWDVDLSSVDVIILFFIHPKIGKLLKKFDAELKPGARVVSYAFSFPNREPAKREGNIFLYIFSP